jgi:hypothetical protein
MESQAGKSVVADICESQNALTPDNCCLTSNIKYRINNTKEGDSARRLLFINH